MRAALIDIGSGKVGNIIELPDEYDPNDKNAYIPPSNQKIQIDAQSKAEIGGFFKSGVWEKPPVVVPIVSPTMSVQEQMNALLSTLVTKGSITQKEADVLKIPK